MSPQNASLAPEQYDGTVHIVLDDFGNSSRSYREVAEEAADFNTVVDDLLSGEFNNPVRVIAFNVSEGWSRDVSEDVARGLLNRAVKEGKPVSGAARRFVELHLGEAELLRAGVTDQTRDGARLVH
jgi:hypothetical protein